MPNLHEQVEVLLRHVVFREGVLQSIAPVLLRIESFVLNSPALPASSPREFFDIRGIDVKPRQPNKARAAFDGLLNALKNVHRLLAQVDVVDPTVCLAAAFYARRRVYSPASVSVTP